MKYNIREKCWVNLLIIIKIYNLMNIYLSMFIKSLLSALYLYRILFDYLF